MLLVDEFTLLLLDEKTRRIHLDEWTQDCVVIGAALLDLAFAGRITVEDDENFISVTDATPTGVDSLDRVLAAIPEAGETKRLHDWITLLRGHAHKILKLSLKRLCESKIIQTDRDENYALSTTVQYTGVYPETFRPRHADEYVVLRLRRILAESDPPHEHDAALVCLGLASGVLHQQLDAELLESSRTRLSRIEKQHHICAAVAAAVQSCFREVRMKPPGTTEIPTSKITDLLMPSMRRGDTGRWLHELYARYGPVFNMPIPGQKQVVLAGAEVNDWVRQNGWKYLQSRDFYAGYDELYGCPGSILSTSGPQHASMRQQAFQRGSLAVFEERFAEILALCRRMYLGWIGRKEIKVQSECRSVMERLVAEIGFSANADQLFPDLGKYEDRAVKTQLMRALPGFLMRTPKMRRIRRKLDRFVDDVLKSHTSGDRWNTPKDMLDTILSQHRADPQAVPLSHLTQAILGALVACESMGNLFSFAVYELLDNPAICAGVRNEADALLDGGEPTFEKFVTSDLTKRFLLEVCRLHPIKFAVVRTGLNPFAIDGRLIAPGCSLLLAFSAPHYAEEHYSNPDQFDPDRFKPDRAEHLKPGVYAPFGCDAHRCPMDRWILFLLQVNILLMAYHLNMEKSPRTYKLRKQPFATLLAPNKKFGFRVESVRKPLEGAPETE